MINNNEIVNPIKVLILSDYGEDVHTGYATVMRNLVFHLKHIFGNTKKIPKIIMNICAINFFGKPNPDGTRQMIIREDEWTTYFSAVFSTPVNKIPESKDDFGRNGFAWVLDHSHDPDEGPDADPYPPGYDLVFILQDAGVINSFAPMIDQIRRKFMTENKKTFKSILYFPIDCDHVLPHLTNNLHIFDRLVTYNQYSRQAVLKTQPELANKLKIVPHGIDPYNFYQVDKMDRYAFRQKYFGENANKFIILNLNRNQPRKDIPCTIFGFMEYKKVNPNAFLYLHMNPRDPMGWELQTVLLQTGLQEGQDYMFPPVEKENHGASVEELRYIYNACDVYLTTTLGEGWGLGVTEAMACGLPVICPLHSSFTEISGHGSRAWVLENLYPVCNMDNMLREQCDFMEVAEKLEQVFRQRAEGDSAYEAKIAAAHQYVRTLHWEHIARMFAHHFKELLKL